MSPITVRDARETIYYSHHQGRLCQWVMVELDNPSEAAERVDLTVTADRFGAACEVDVRPGAHEYRCYAPAVWPEGAVDAELCVTGPDTERRVSLRIGSHRPWTIHLVSDLCADDLWSYDDVATFDRDDYLTTLAELHTSPDNCYNFATVYQTDRFYRQASPAERAELRRALRSGRFHVTPVPDQLLCGAFVLSAYPLLLEPYRQACMRFGRPGEPLSQDAYHMEATTWTNGLVNLLSCAGFRSFTKSLLLYQAPWIKALSELPRLMRLEVAPGRAVLFLLRCGDYMEGQPVLRGVPELTRVLHEQVIPSHEHLGGAYPVDVIPLVGSYGDLAPGSKELAAVKVRNLNGYNAQGWEYPRLMHSTFARFFDQAVPQLGFTNGHSPRPLKTVRGDTGSSWEVWGMAVQAEYAAFRRAQRDAVSLLALDAIRVRPQTVAVRSALHSCVMETVYLGDHAWNGDDGRPEVKAANLAVRRRRLDRIADSAARLRHAVLSRSRLRDKEMVAVVNTLGWRRPCRVLLPDGVISLADTKTGQAYPAAADGWAVVPDVPPFGSRELAVRRNADREAAQLSAAPLPKLKLEMAPVLYIGQDEIPTAGEWFGRRGRWNAGPFEIGAVLSAWQGGGMELRLEVRGAPPEAGHELCWRFKLPWRRCVWRGESGGGFTTPGPTGKGGDSLLGIAGSVFSAGEGLSAAGRRGKSRIDFALDESGLCGLGGRTTTLARGTYGETIDEDMIRSTMMRRCDTDGVLLWYLLGNGQNFREALQDQGGCRAWSFRCGIRAVDGGFDDVDLYRFAAGFNRPAELALPTELARGRGEWLSVQPDDRVLILGVRRGRQAYEVDVYNTASERVEVRLRGWLVRGRALKVADMLGFQDRSCKRGRIALAPRAYVKVLTPILSESDLHTF